MDLYHSWLYIHVLNTTWFVWAVVIIVFGFNLIAPIIIWFVMNGRRINIPFMRKKEKARQ
ncbi:hypothetical protein [Fredinandcohnia sp. 179-A 10B2 NHS]|uniref:hypothetical protein n=1 Tax=Fredinandcohnia sp. 179-A 10B2 NHS TaxID=3235176 RepID=UPI0039A2DE1E